jgi:cell division protein FtsB
MWEKRGSITMVALMAMLVLSLYGVILYGRSVSAYLVQESQIEQLQKTYSGDLDAAYNIADSLK